MGITVSHECIYADLIFICTTKIIYLGLFNFLSIKLLSGNTEVKSPDMQHNVTEVSSAQCSA